MFSLIISIIAIALVAALALASIYYGGSAFNEGTAKADASTLINQGQQIQAAITMQNVNRDSAVTTLADLKPDYLQEVPEFMGEAWGEPADTTTTGEAGYSLHGATLVEGVCDAINEQAGIDTAPVAGSETGLFGCNDAKVAYYRVGEFYL